MKKISLMLLLIVYLCFSTINPNIVIVNAGYNGNVISDNSMFDSLYGSVFGYSIDFSEWKYIRNFGIEMQDNKLLFTKNWDIGNPFLSRTSVEKSDDVNDCLHVDFDMNINNITENKKFGFVFGIPRLDGDVENSNSSFLYFYKNDSKYYCGLSNFNETETVLFNDLEIDGYQLQNIMINFDVTSNGKLFLKINNQIIYQSNVANEVNAEGYLGFTQSGNYTDNTTFVEIEITSLNISNSYYSRPEAPLIIKEDFNDNLFNANAWSLMSTASPYGKGLFIKDGVLKFDGAGENSNFLSDYKYSNFELKYDLFDIINDATTDSISGDIIAASQWQGVSWGELSNEQEQVLNSYVNCSFVYFCASFDSVTGERNNDTSLNFMLNGTQLASIKLPLKYQCFNKGYDDKVCIKISVIDGILKVKIKLINEIEYTEIFTYEYKNHITPIGYVIIRAEGNQYVKNWTIATGSYYSIDNVSLLNLDIDPNVKEIEFKSNIVAPLNDYVYYDPWSDNYLISKTKGKGLK